MTEVVLTYARVVIKRKFPGLGKGGCRGRSVGSNRRQMFKDIRTKGRATRTGTESKRKKRRHLSLRNREPRNQEGKGEAWGSLPGGS